MATALQTELVSHAFIALDHDEYRAEHIILDTHEGTVRRIYHYYAYPRNDGAYYTDGEPSVCDQLPGTEEPVGGGDPGVLVDGQLVRSTVAALYGVPVATVGRAADADAVAYRELDTVGGPCDAWCAALGLSWSGESDDGWELIDQD
ncbi:hypothetical protein [Nocardia grenadensis]|uniref:hypothetical protein n=1 Tax=Nocardia grenadensis TaxID=931537 RepID=UPI0007A3E732|nr:hypothetical protein [Nocardia grenadensis]